MPFHYEDFDNNTSTEINNKIFKIGFIIGTICTLIGFMLSVISIAEAIQFKKYETFFYDTFTDTPIYLSFSKQFLLGLTVSSLFFEPIIIRIIVKFVYFSI